MAGARARSAAETFIPPLGRRKRLPYLDRISIRGRAGASACLPDAQMDCCSLFRSLWQVVLPVSDSLPRLPIHEVGVDEGSDIAVEHAVDIADGELGAMVLDQAIWCEHIAADLAAEVDIEL